MAHRSTRAKSQRWPMLVGKEKKLCVNPDQGCGSWSEWIRIIFGIWIGISVTGKSWTRIRNKVRNGRNETSLSFPSFWRVAGSGSRLSWNTRSWSAWKWCRSATLILILTFLIGLVSVADPEPDPQGSETFGRIRIQNRIKNFCFGSATLGLFRCHGVSNP
jgi:hypothetical protein